MLNTIWLALLFIGILVAIGTDLNDLSTGRYHNGAQVAVSLAFPTAASEPMTPGVQIPCTLSVYRADYAAAYGEESGRETTAVAATLVPSDATGGVVQLTVDASTPALWSAIARSQHGTLAGRLRWEPGGIRPVRALLRCDPVRFVRMNAVTNDGIIKYAKTAVELAIGLIGIMALWLGIMKIAEQSGLVAKLAAGLRPVTTRLFPDVPPDHPAMGAMIMNISANMLGLANAATPLGLKAMDELNKLNKKLGTATDAMCTFLVINTSNVQLIPATVIAIRAAAGASNPTDIIGPVLVATTVNTIVGVFTVKMLAKLPVFRRQLEPEG
jgi:spore maturation protein A